MTKETRTFEKVMEELEEITKKLEEADVPLDEAVAYYQKGIELSRWCDQKLTEVEKQVAEIVDEEGNRKSIEVEEG